MRVEFFFKAQSELSSLVNFMNAYPRPAEAVATSLITNLAAAPPKLFSKFNLANKVKNDNLLESAKNIIRVMPEADVCVHYSLKYNSQKSVEQSFTYFNGFLLKAEEIGVKEVMIISGSGDKKALNTVSCLQMLHKSENRATDIDIAVAFNPYFPDPKSRAVEVERLNEKLATGMVSAIYLQFGSDLTLLREGLTAIQAALALNGNMSRKTNGKEPKLINVLGSVMIPSKQLLARMKFRPWNGVFLSTTFLSDVPTAESIVREMLEIYKSFNVEPLVETAFKNNLEAAHILALLSGEAPVERKITESNDLSKEISEDDLKNDIGGGMLTIIQPSSQKKRRSVR